MTSTLKPSQKLLSEPRRIARLCSSLNQLWLIGAVWVVCGSCRANERETSEALERITAPIAPRNIQILLEKDASEALLEIKGSYYIFNPHDGRRIASGLLGKRFIIRERENGLKWGEEFPGVHQLYIRPRSTDSSVFVNGIQYSGGVAIYGINGTINIVNDLDIESYVKSILTAQFSTPLEQEVMSALAILVRTNAYYAAMKSAESFWHANASENGYCGSALAVANSSIERAVDTTRHLILVHPEDGGGRVPFATAWTEHSAGKTAAFDTIFRKNALAPGKGVPAPHAALVRQDSKWTYSIGQRQLANLLGLREIKGVEVFVDPPSGKVYGLRVKDSSDFHDVDFFTLQNRVGSSHIRSSDFTVSLKEETVLFTGYGRGHGVGLCLYSASAMAQNGENAVKILSKFFPETFLYNLDALPDGLIR